jgi:hypothetical protein
VSLDLYRNRRFLSRVVRSPQRRHLFRWLASRREGYLIETPSPWMTFDAIDRIASHLRDGMRVFEYGSGGSTLFWLRWKVELVSIEHDTAWFDVVKGKLPIGAKVDYRLVPADPFAEENVGKDPADPLAYVSSDEPFRGQTFRGYATQIDGYPDAHFDLVIVDGRARPSCLWHAAPKVRPGGLLVLDNANREYYLKGQGPRLAGFRRERYEGIGPVDAWRSETDVFLRAS